MSELKHVVPGKNGDLITPPPSKEEEKLAWQELNDRRDSRSGAGCLFTAASGVVAGGLAFIASGEPIAMVASVPFMAVVGRIAYKIVDRKNTADWKQNWLHHYRTGDKDDTDPNGLLSANPPPSIR